MHTSTLQIKWQLLSALWIAALILGCTLVLALLLGTANPRGAAGDISVEFRNEGAMESAGGFRLVGQHSSLSILVRRDGYVSVSADSPDWFGFPHIRTESNRLLLTSGDSKPKVMVLFINGERVWSGQLSVDSDYRCELTTTGDASIVWLSSSACR